MTLGTLTITFTIIAMAMMALKALILALTAFTMSLMALTSMTLKAFTMALADWCLDGLDEVHGLGCLDQSLDGLDPGLGSL